MKRGRTAEVVVSQALVPEAIVVPSRCLEAHWGSIVFFFFFEEVKSVAPCGIRWHSCLCVSK